MTLENRIKQRAIALGFDVVGITHAGAIDPEQAERMSAWLDAGFAAQMKYMHRNLEKRLNPSKLLTDAKSIIVAALNYKPPKHVGWALPTETPQIPAATRSVIARSKATKQSPAFRTMSNTGAERDSSHYSTGRIADYAMYEDYHQFVKKRLRKLADFIASVADEDVRFKMCVDSAPVAERALAVRAGLGFIAKNHMLTIPKLGQEVFLAELITTLELKPDEPASKRCSECSKCIDACPTGALRPDGAFDATKCISYLTIEHKGEIPSDLAASIGDRLFGCDQCVEACPYQKEAPPCSNKEIKFYPDRARIDLGRIETMTEEEFQTQFGDSPIERLGLQRLKRNAEITADHQSRPGNKPET